MVRSTQRQAPRKAPPRAAPRRYPGAGGRRPGHSGPGPVWLLIVALVLTALAGGAFIFWQTRPDGAAQAAPAPAAPESDLVADAATATPTPTPTPPVVSSGSVPGGGDAPAPTAALPARATPAATGIAPATPFTPTSSAPVSGATVAAPAPAATQPAPSPAAAPVTDSAAPNLPALAARMLELVNADRAANGLQPVAWDDTAALAGQLHSEEMAEFGYMSHWNMDGYGPEVRYSRAGGLDIAQENVYRLVYQWEDGRGAPIDNWEKVLSDAQAALMNSPGHRRNILAPEHTHLGVGIAYNAATGNVAISQEFVNRYVTIEPLPKRAQGGDRLVVRGALLPGSADPLVNIAYQPFPAPLTLEQLNKTSTYQSAAEHMDVPPVRAEADGRFVSEFTLPKDAPPGLYHVWLWVKSPVASEPVQAVNAVIEVSE